MARLALVAAVIWGILVALLGRPLKVTKSMFLGVASGTILTIMLCCFVTVILPMKPPARKRESMSAKPSLRLLAESVGLTLDRVVASIYELSDGNLPADLTSNDYWLVLGGRQL